MGYEACIDAEKNQPISGETGAGIGASVGKICDPARATKTGLGIYAVSLGELKIAVVVLNALGDIFDPSTGKQIARLRSADGIKFESSCQELYKLTQKTDLFNSNTTKWQTAIPSMPFLWEMFRLISMLSVLWLLR